MRPEYTDGRYILDVYVSSPDRSILSIIRLPIIAAFLVYFFVRIESIASSARAGVLLLAYLLIYVSYRIVGSSSLFDGLYGSVDCVVICLFPLLLATQISLAFAILVTWVAMAGLILVSAAFSLAGDPHAISQTGEWRGLFAHKNAFGAYAALALLLGLYSQPLKRLAVWLRWPVLVLLAMALLGSRSVGALGGTIVAILATSSRIAIYRSPDGATSVMVVFSLVLLSLLVWLLSPYILDLIGRDLTLTGRTRLWLAVWPIILEHPFGLGIGGAAGPEVRAALYGVLGQQYYAVDSGYLVLAIEMGWIAPIIYVFWLLYLLFGRTREGREAGVNTGLWSIAVFAMCQAIIEKAGAPYPYLTFALIILLLIMSLSDREKGQRSGDTTVKSPPQRLRTLWLPTHRRSFVGATRVQNRE